MSRGKRRPRDAAGVSSFPFLAVLLCTVGALIVLLVIIARRAEAQAREEQLAVAEKSREEQKQQQQALVARQLSFDQQSQELRSQANAVAAALTAKQRVSARLQAELEAALRQLRQLQEQQRDLQRLATEKSSDEQLRKELGDLDERLKQARAILTDRQRAAAASPQELYSIMPYAGRNGAARRPIYVECRGDRVILQPEGTELPAADFEVLGPGNPLEAAVRATIAHWERSAQAQGNPYPLLLVRPDGVPAYSAAREALSTWGREFGYELVDQDWTLAYPPADPALAQQQQLAAALGRQQMEALAKNQTRRRRSSPSFRISTTGSLERLGGGNEDDRFTGMGTPRGGGADAGGFGPGPGPGAVNAGARPGREVLGNGPGYGQGTGSSSELSPRGNTTADDPLASRFAQSQPQRLPFRPSGQGIAGHNGAGPLRGGGPSNGGPLNSGPLNGGPLNGGPFNGGALQGGPLNGGQGGGTLSSGQEPRVGPPNRRGNSSDPFAGIGSQLDRAQGIDPQPGGAAAGAAGGAESGLPAGRGPRGGSGPGGPGGPGGGVVGFGAPGAYGAGGPGGPSMGGPGGIGMPAATQSGQPSADQMPEESAPNWSFGKTAPVTPIANKEGTNWALPTKPVRGSSPLRRDVHLMVDESAITVFVDPRTAQTLQIIRLGPDPDEAVGELKDAIWKVMKDWGNAPHGFYWRPVLRTRVTARGGARYAQLDALLEDSGFELGVGQ